MNIALLFYGQPRFIGHPEIYQSYKQNIIDKYNVDIYCHCWLPNNAGKYETSQWSHISNCKAEDGAVQTIMNQYDPVKIIFEKPKYFECSQKIHNFFSHNKFSPHNYHYSETDFNNICSQLYSIEQVSNLVEKSYDFYILARYDSIIKNCLDYTSIKNNKLYCPNTHNNMPDMIMSFGPKYLSWSKNLYTDILDVYPNVANPTPESFKKSTFLNRHSQIDIMPCDMDAIAIRK